MEFIWALVAVLVGAPVGVTAALQWGKTREKKLAVDKIKAESEHAKVTLQLEKQHEAAQAAETDRAHAEFDLKMLDTPEGRDLKASEMALTAAQNRLATEKAEIQARAVAATLDLQITAEKELVAARQKARIEAAVKHARSETQPPLPLDPISKFDLNKAYKNYLDSVPYDVTPDNLGIWLGVNYVGIMASLKDGGK